MWVRWRAGEVRLVFGAPPTVAAWTNLAAALAWMESAPSADDLTRVASALSPLLVASDGLEDEDDEPVDLASWPAHDRQLVLIEEMSPQDLLDVAGEVVALVELPVEQLQDLSAWVKAKVCGWRAPALDPRVMQLYLLASSSPPSWDAPPWAAQVHQAAERGRNEGYAWRAQNPNATPETDPEPPEWKTQEHAEGNAALRSMIQEMR